MSRQTQSIAVDAVVVGSRYRSPTDEAIRRLAASITDIGLRTPITVRVVMQSEEDDGTGAGDLVLVTGATRLEAVKSLGHETIEAFVVEDGDETDARMWEIAENLHRAELTALERDEQVAEWVRLAAEKASQVVTPAGGRQPTAKGVRQAERDLGINRMDASRATRVASLSPEAKEAARELGLDDNRSALLEAASTGDAVEQVEVLRERASRNRVTLNTGNNEWFTPAEYVERARQVLGEIDLDPASNRVAQATVRAARYYTAEDDGLKQEWAGRVWLNPPYAQPLIGQFVEKLIAERKSGLVSAAVLLTNDCTDTAWFHAAAGAASAMCFTRGRVRFVSPAGEFGSPTQGQVFFYFGDDVGAFVKVFADVGLVIVDGAKGGGWRMAGAPTQFRSPTDAIRAACRIVEELAAEAGPKRTVQLHGDAIGHELAMSARRSGRWLGDLADASDASRVGRGDAA